MIVLAIDPGCSESAWVIYDASSPKVLAFGKEQNAVVLELLAGACSIGDGVLGGLLSRYRPDQLAIEMIASYGMPVGREVFETCLWIGRFIERWENGTVGKRACHHTLVYRKDVKLHLCGQARAKDGNVRQALIDRFGPGKERAVGTKQQQGPLYGLKADVWQALAVAVTHADGGAA